MEGIDVVKLIETEEVWGKHLQTIGQLLGSMGINGKLTSKNSERLRTVEKYFTETHLRQSTADFSLQID